MLVSRITVNEWSIFRLEHDFLKGNKIQEVKPISKIAITITRNCWRLAILLILTFLPKLVEHVRALHGYQLNELLEVDLEDFEQR